MPLDEFPKTNLEYFTHEKYFKCPRFKKYTLFLFSLTNFLTILKITLYSGSLLGIVNIILVSFNFLRASSICLKYVFEDFFSKVTG